MHIEAFSLVRAALLNEETAAVFSAQTRYFSDV